MQLQLRRRTVEQLSSTTSDGELTGFYNGDLEDDLVALLPHLGHECLAGVDAARESDLDIAERAIRLQDVLARNTHEAETCREQSIDQWGVQRIIRVQARTMQNGLIKPAHRSKFWLNLTIKFAKLVSCSARLQRDTVKGMLTCRGLGSPLRLCAIKSEISMLGRRGATHR